MADLPWSRAGLDHSAESRANIEALQTDVMRFMAILGFCLMAIFALVHSIPPAALTAEPEMTAVEPPSAAMDDAREKLELLNHELEEVGKEVEKARRQRDSTLVTLGSLKASEQALAERQSRARILYRQQLAKIAKVEQKLRTEEHALRAVQARRKETPTALEASQTADTEERRQPRGTLAKPAGKAPTRVAKEPTSTPAPTPAPVSTAAPTPAPKKDPKQPEKKTFALRFASDTSLRALIAQHEVGFFGFVGEDAWRLSLDTGLLTYQRAPTPKRFHEMTPETVPQAFVQALHRTVGTDPHGNTSWGVTLPRTIQEQIHRLVEGGTGGTLVIQPNGRVRLSANTAGS